jgi:hypothetical protein
VAFKTGDGLAPLPRDFRMAAAGRTVAEYHLLPTLLYGEVSWSNTDPAWQLLAFLLTDVLDTLSVALSVPGPVVGAELPSLLMAVAVFIGWRRSPAKRP